MCIHFSSITWTTTSSSNVLCKIQPAWSSSFFKKIKTGAFKGDMALSRLAVFKTLILFFFSLIFLFLIFFVVTFKWFRIKNIHVWKCCRLVFTSAQMKVTALDTLTVPNRLIFILLSFIWIFERDWLIWHALVKHPHF